MLMKDQKKGMLVAMKMLTRQETSDANMALSEAATLFRFVHPNIVRCFDVFLNMDGGLNVCVVLEYCEQGDLNAYLKKLSPSSTDLKSKQVRLPLMSCRPSSFGITFF